MKTRMLITLSSNSRLERPKAFVLNRRPKGIKRSLKGVVKRRLRKKKIKENGVDSGSVKPKKDQKFFFFSGEDQRECNSYLILGLLQTIAKRKIDPRLYADELGRGFVGELDYTLEGGLQHIKHLLYPISSKVLGKIWSVAFKYHFRMPAYYTLVLRSLASFKGLAIAADRNFKTFEAAYPYVVRKLLTENSAATRKILHSVLLNRKKEFQWQRLSMFLRVGATRKALQLVASNSETSADHSPKKAAGTFDFAYLILRVLPSKDGASLRRLLMTANGASLIRAMVSKEGKVIRQQLCKVIADALCQLMIKLFGQGATDTQYPRVMLANGPSNKESGRSSSAAYDYNSIFRDRRLRVIFSKVLKSASSDKVLMLRFCWSSLVIMITASTLACHRVVLSLSEAYLGPIFDAPKRTRYAVNA